MGRDWVVISLLLKINKLKKNTFFFLVIIIIWVELRILPLGEGQLGKSYWLQLFVEIKVLAGE